jgi:PAS domain-containing protein
VTIFLDLDGVLADFDRSAQAILGVPPREFEGRHGTPAFWATLRRRAPGLYAELPLMADARELWDGVRTLAGQEPVILTGVPRWRDAGDQKRRWAAQHFPGASVITTFAARKSDHARPGDVLIDDNPRYADRWEAKGGVFIVHRSAEASLAALRRVLADRNLD